MNPILKKLFFKGQSPLLLIQAPGEFKKIAKDFGVPLHSGAKGKYGFALAFVKSLSEGEKLAKTIGKSLEEEAVFWVAYPKGTFQKYKSGYNRDTGNTLMEKHGFTGVSLVALDDDWSAMRFRAKSS